jgi:hypothetical protein
LKQKEKKKKEKKRKAKIGMIKKGFPTNEKTLFFFCV